MEGCGVTPFNVGDKVICIDAKVGFEQFIEIKEGEVYTISWIGPFDHYTQGSYIGVRLKGVDRGICPQFGYDNPPFAARRYSCRISRMRAFRMQNSRICISSST